MTDNTERAQVGWRFWLGWMLASAVGITVGLPVGFFVGATVDLAHLAVGLALVLWFAVFGAAVGIAQWFVLRREVSRAGWWVLASTVGFVVAASLLKALDGAVASAMEETVRQSVGAAVFGAAVGIAQWFVLRREVSRAGWWVLASTVGFAVGGALFLAAFVFDVIGTDSSDGVGLVLGLALYGAITGGAMVWLLRPPEEAEPGFKLDKRIRTWLLLAAVFLIVLMAGYFLFVTIKANNIIAGLEVPPCSEVYVAPLIRDRRVTTCHIKRADCNFSTCFDGPSESRSFILTAGFRLDNFDGECLLVTGKAGKRGDIPYILTYDQSDVEICQ